MKKELLLFGCMLLCSSIANADGNRKIRADVFPSLLSVQKRNFVSDLPSRSLNSDKDKGLSMWATTMTDMSDGPGFVNFYSENPNSLNKSGLIKSPEEDNLRRWTMVGGCMHNGQYLGYMFYRFDLGMNYVKCFAKVDLENGTWEELRDMSELEGDWDYMEGMASDPKSGKLIGVPRKKDGTVGSTIGEVDPATGVYTKWYDLDYYYFSIAYDSKGTLWAVRWVSGSNNDIIGSCLVTLDPKNNYKEVKKADLAMGGKPFKMYYQNSLQFDYTNGDLWILAASGDTGEQYLCKIDTLSGEMESKGRLGWGDVASGLYIPYYVADAPDAAYRVTNLTSTFDDNGVVTLSWTNPTVTWDKQELTELAEVLVYRDGLDDENLVETIPGENKVGEDMSWTDNSAEQGIHTYYVIPCRRAGEKGIPDSWRAFSGRDVPGTPGNIDLVKDGSSLVLTWSAPEIGMHDGWYDKSSLSYTITRYPDEKVVAENYTETTFTDTELNEIQNYYYMIKAVSLDGEGGTGVSQQVMAGSSLNAPFTTDFSSEAEAAQWTSVDANQDGIYFVYTTFPVNGLKLDMYMSSNDDYAISPSFNLKGGTTYKLIYNVYFHYSLNQYSPDQYHDFRFTAGQGLTAEDQNIEIDKREDFFTESDYQVVPFEMFFTPDVDGEYNFSFNYTTKDAITDVVALTGFSIEEVFSKDLSAQSFDGDLNPTKGMASDYTVTVKNEGSQAVDNYSVKIVRTGIDGNIVLGETKVTEKLETMATTNVIVSAVPDVEGEFEMAAVACLEGDQNMENDTSAARTITASPEGTMPFNVYIFGEDQKINTRYPISFFERYSCGQSIYHADEFGLDGQQTVRIHRIALEYDTLEPTEEFNVAVYLGMTDKGSIASTSDFVPLADLTKVYEGTNIIVDGKDNLMVFEFDTPYEYDLSKNLIFTITKDGNVSSYFPAEFKIFNQDYSIPESEFRSFRYENSSSPDPDVSISETVPDIPVIHFAVEMTAGLENVSIGGNSIIYNGGSINVNGIDAVSIAVYDIMGRIVLDRSMSDGQTSVKADIRQGVYIVKVIDRDGKTYIKKMRVAK